MKNKKLFAILTLVCFMFTLMPVAAFAATTDYVGVNGKDTVSVKVGDTVVADVWADETNEASGTYYFWAEDGEEKVVAVSDNGEFVFEDVDTYYVFAVADFDASEMTTSTKAAIVELIKDRYDAKIVDDALTVKVKKADTTYVLDADNKNITSLKANNGWNSAEVTVSLVKNVTEENPSGTPVKGAEISYSTNSAYVDVVAEEEVTDRNGEQVITISASKAGNYKVFAKYGDAEKLTINVTATANGYAAIETVAQPANTVALDTAFDNGYTGIAFKVTSTDGSVIKGGTLGASVAKVTVVEAPADSMLNDIEEGDLYLAYDANVNNAFVLKGADLSFDEEGTYEFKVALENGSSAVASVKILEFDEPVAMSLTYKANTVAYGDTAAVKAVVLVDKNGTTKTITSDNDYTIVYAANGKAVAAVDADGTIHVEAEEDFIGSTISAMAIVEDLELTATATLTVADKAAELKYLSKNAEIAVNNNLVVRTVDAEGNVVAAVADNNATTPSAINVYVLDAPKNAAYSVSGAVKPGTTDTIIVTFTASAAGEYKLHTIARTGDTYLSSVDTIVVGGTVGTFKDVVVMSIGAPQIVVNSDVKAIPAAPMIQDNRTFVPFRALAEAFGAEVAWDEATQSVVAELNGVKVVMTIGSDAYTVNGVAAEADVAPFINGASTMVPVRFVAEAFGINVTPIYAENGAVADVLFAK